MSVAAPVAVHVPFLDLKAQYNSIREEIQEAINAVLESGHFVGGKWVEQFEEDLAQYVGARCAVSVASGTDALELAFKAARIGPGDEVIVPANTFFATAEAVTNVGARAVFADVSPLTFHLDPSSVAKLITKRTRAIVPVHLYGRAANLTEIERLAEADDLLIIEDACQAIGAEHDGMRVGGSGRLTCFSFYPGKNLGAYGDGGAVTCNDPKAAETIRMLRDHGSPRKYHHVMVGKNSRLDGLQAAILSVKLRYLDDWNRERARHATALIHALGGPGIRPPFLPGPGEHNFHLFVVRARRRDELKHFLEERGIGTGIHYPVPLHLTPAYQALGVPGHGSCPIAEALADEILSLPMYAELTDDQIETIVGAVREFLNEGSVARAA